jgi:hypothetical protein
MMRDPFGLEPDAFKNQLTAVEWHNSGVEKEEASPLNAGSEYSESVKKEIIRANKNAWNLQMRDRDAADKAGAGTLEIAGPLALTVAAVDGPLPIGDVIASVILAGATTYDATQRTFVTYTMRNSAGQIYIGRTSGYGDPYSIMAARAAGHHMKALGYGVPILDRAVQGYQGYPAIRGREQQLIDYYGGVGSSRVGNRIRGVSQFNPAYPIYHEASNLYFGQIAPFTGFKF